MQQLHDVSDDGSGTEEERKKRGEDSMKGKTRRFKGSSHADLWIVENELIECRSESELGESVQDSFG
jgi:hypothetical protein